jgi:phosphatidylserine/phosphatidylglycerophosphate/cardiolipin synthase-like enzyme
MRPDECYLISVDQLWQEELARASVNALKVIICSPYLTSPTADAVISSAPAERCEIYTRFSVEDFAAGSSSIRTLKDLLKKGYKLFSIGDLHAKIVLVSGCFVSIGSQNLTAQGIRNKEATAISKDPDIVAQVEALLQSWITQGREITLDIITDLESKLPRLAKRFDAFRKVAQQIESQVQQEEELRVAREIHRQQRQNQVNEARSTLHELFPQR